MSTLKKIFVMVFLTGIPVNLAFADQNNGMVMINVYFEADLKGPRQDIEQMRKWSVASGVPTLEISQETIQKKGKEAALAEITKFAKNAKVVNFNYSGHGVRRVVSEGVYGEPVNNKGMPCKLPSSSTEASSASETCESKTVKEPVYQHILSFGGTRECYDNCYFSSRDKFSKIPKAPVCQTWEKLEEDCYKPFYQCTHERRNLPYGEVITPCLKFDQTCKDKEKQSPLAFECKKIKEEREAKMEKEDNACFTICLQKQGISSDDLSQAFAGKAVFGVIDSCHSEGFAANIKNSNKAFAVSAKANEVSSDTPKGGVLMRSMATRHETTVCGVDGNKETPITVSEFFNGKYDYKEIMKGPKGTPIFVSTGGSVDQYPFIANRGEYCGGKMPSASDGSVLGGPGAQ